MPCFVRFDFAAVSVIEHNVMVICTPVNATVCTCLLFIKKLGKDYNCHIAQLSYCYHCSLTIYIFNFI